MGYGCWRRKVPQTEAKLSLMAEEYADRWKAGGGVTWSYTLYRDQLPWHPRSSLRRVRRSKCPSCAQKLR